MIENLSELEQEFQSGLKLIQNGQLDKAESKLLSILEHLPDNPALHERIGYCYALQNNWGQAEEHYWKASKLSPENSEITNNLGCVLQKQDRWEDALPLFVQAYKASPENLNALCNLAQTLNHCGKHDEAVIYYTEAINKQPDQISLRYQLAEILHLQQRYEEEIAQYRFILAGNEQTPKANIKMALALFASGEREQAGQVIASINETTEAITITLFEWAKKEQEQERFDEAAYALGVLTKFSPENLDYWKTYVVNHYFAFGFEKSLTVYEEAIQRFPQEASFQQGLAIAYGQAGETPKSLEYAKNVLDLSPQSTKAHRTYACILRQYQKTCTPVASVEEAVNHFNKAISLAESDSKELQEIAQTIIETKEIEIMKRCIAELPEKLKNSFLHHLLLNFISTTEGKFEQAVMHGEMCRKLAPENSFALSELSETYFAMENYEAALATGREAIKVNPKDSQAVMRLGHITVDCGLVDEGLSIANHALELNPHDPAANLSAGLINLLLGNWERGWELYDARFKMQYKHRVEVPPIPRWDGNLNENLELVIVCEQGLGDIIQFGRFLPNAAKCAKKTVFVSNNGLMHFFKPYSDVVEIHPSQSEFSINAEHGRWVSVVDLPRLLNISEKHWATSVPYFHADRDIIEKWKNVIEQTDKLKVGIAWQGSPGARIDIGRSIPLKYFEPISQLDNVQLFCLQKYYGEEQLEEVPFKDKVIHLGENFDTGPNAFSDTAAVMSLLDLVITSDTSIAHLAGALGRPAWVALKHVPDWRWQLSTDKCSWYPTMKLFRQNVPGQWTDVFTDITQNLKKMS